MKILLLGEASFVHSTLRKGFGELGHNVTLVSAGCIWDCPRDIDVSRDMRWGKLGGFKVIWQILSNIKLFIGNDILIYSRNFVSRNKRNLFFKFKCNFSFRHINKQ